MIARFVCLFVFCGSLFAQQSSQTSLTPLSPGFRGGAARGCSGSEVRRKGRVRFCRRNDDGQIDFTGENVIDHTARDETVRIYPGNAFALTGERRRTNYIVEIGKSTATESFEIKVRHHKKEPVEVRVVEHLYRALTWEVASSSSADYKKTDSQTIEFPVTVAPDGEKTITRDRALPLVKGDRQAEANAILRTPSDVIQPSVIFPYLSAMVRDLLGAAC
jgi:hypothetical protein